MPGVTTWRPTIEETGITEIVAPGTASRPGMEAAGLRTTAPPARAAGECPRQEAGAERIGEYIAPEAVERFAIVPDEDDVALLLHDVGDGVPGECQRSSPAGKDRPRAGEDEPPARLRRIVRHGGRGAEMTGFGADHAVPRLDERQAMRLPGQRAGATPERARRASHARSRFPPRGGPGHRAPPSGTRPHQPLARPPRPAIAAATHPALRRGHCLVVP